MLSWKKSTKKSVFTSNYNEKKLDSKIMARRSILSELPTVLITGASSGIGRGIAEGLAETGKYKLALLARRQNELVKTVELCKQLNPQIETLILPCDATNEEQFKDCINVVGNEFGPLCCCIHNAGIYYQTFIDETADINKTNQCLDINLKSVIHGCTYCVPFIKKKKKKYGNKISCAVIIIASDSSTIRATGPREGIYCATKYGVLGFAECLYHELKEYGIKVSSIMPGWVNTPMSINFNKKYKNNLNVNQLILENLLQVEDIAYTVNYILNAPSTCVPLQVLLVPQYPWEQNQIKNSQIVSKL